MIDPWIWLGLFILIAYTIEAITGFGSIVIALSLGALWLPIPAMLPILVPLNICMSGYLTYKHREHIQWPLLLKLILPFMLIGTITGYLLTPIVKVFWLKMIFGALVVWFAGRELWRHYRGNTSKAHHPLLSQFITLIAGLTHGLFASGGPLLVYALAGKQMDKSRTRATLLIVWFTLNLLLTILFLVDGRLLESFPRLVSYAPLLLIGVFLGEWLHHRLNEAKFRLTVYWVLIFTGSLLLVREF